MRHSNANDDVWSMQLLVSYAGYDDPKWCRYADLLDFYGVNGSQSFRRVEQDAPIVMRS